MNPHFAAQNPEIHAKFALGVTRLRAAEQNQSALEQALLSFHGALEDHLRLALSDLAIVSADTRASVADRSKTQWRDLAGLAQAYRIITTNQKQLILRMNAKRQTIAHGKACELSKQEVVQYAEFIRAVIHYQEPIAPDSPAPRPARAAQHGAGGAPAPTAAYGIAIGLASIILLVMVLGVVVMLLQPKAPALARSAGAAPEAACVIKGNISISTGIRYYHLPGMEDYDATVISPAAGERWFCTEAEAIAQGWRKAPR